MATIAKIKIRAGKGAKVIYALKYDEGIWIVSHNPYSFEILKGEVVSATFPSEIVFKFFGKQLQFTMELFEVSDDIIRLEFKFKKIGEGVYKAIPLWGFKVYPKKSIEQFEKENFLEIKN